METKEQTEQRREEKTMKRILVLMLALAVAVTVTGCATGISQTGKQGAGIGAVLGGVAGALIDNKNPWRGGVIGAGAGALTMGTVGELSARGAREAAETGRTVEYKTADGRGVYQAVPSPSDPVTKCRKVRERVTDGDTVVKDQVREVCESKRTDSGY